MSLDDELRATLSRQAEMRTPPPPDVDSLIRGGRVRRHRRNLMRVGVAAASTALVGTASYGVMQIDGTDPSTDTVVAGTPAQPSAPTTTPPHLPTGGNPTLKPGAYRVIVGADGTGDVIEADLTVEGENWSVGNFPLVSDEVGQTYAGFGVYQPYTLADGTGCTDDEPTSNLGETPRELAAQLAAMPQSTVLKAPIPMRAFGYPAVHLQLRIDVDCPDWYRVADTVRGDRGITYPTVGKTPKPVVIDFWVLDVRGAPVVVDQWHNSDAPEELVDQATRARESITLVTGEYPRP